LFKSLLCILCICKLYLSLDIAFDMYYVHHEFYVITSAIHATPSLVWWIIVRVPKCCMKWVISIIVSVTVCTLIVDLAEFKSTIVHSFHCPQFYKCFLLVDKCYCFTDNWHTWLINKYTKFNVSHPFSFNPT